MGGKGKGVHAIGRTKVRSCTCLDGTSCTLRERVAVGAMDNPRTWLYKEHNFSCFLHAAMQGGNIEVLKHSQVI